METTLNSSQANTNNTNNTGAPPVLLNATLEDEKLYFTEEIVRLEHSIKLLTESNVILSEQGDTDPDFVLAIDENEKVIAKYKKIVKGIRERLDAISQSSCLNQIAGSSIDLNKDNISESEINKSLESLKLTTQEASSLESIPTFNSSSEDSHNATVTEKDKVESEEKSNNEEEGIFL